MSAPSYQTIVSAPGFSLGVCCSADEITRIDYLSPRPEQAPKALLAREAVRQLRAYFKNPRFDFSLPLAIAGTHFQRRVWNAIAGIPSGRTASYGELAAKLASGARAVGGACGANPYPLVVPCHRVIAADGQLGGFGRDGGDFLLAIKRWLLDHEQRAAKG